MSKVCSKCKETKDESSYYPDSARCKRCVIKQARISNLKSQYGITEADYTEMLEKQNGGCAICERKENNNPRMKYFCVDHDHKTGAVRELLCQECNFFLGKLEAQMPIIDRFFNYLQKHQWLNQPN